MPEIAVVTGGGTGIGRAIALELARIGALVIISGRREAPLLETSSIIAAEGGNADYFVADISSATCVNNLIGYIKSKYGGVDILVNNAGMDLTGPFSDMTYEKWETLLAVNLTAPYLMAYAVVPGMLLKERGIIVNIASVLGVNGVAWYTGYSASKAGLRGLSEALAEELRPHGIRVHCICPGRVSTDMQIRLGGERVAAISMRPEKVSAVVRSIVAGDKSFPTIMVIDNQPLALKTLDLYVRLRWMALSSLKFFRSLLTRKGK